VRKGGTLVAISNAGAMDRYDEPTDVMADLKGIAAKQRDRILIPSLTALKRVGSVAGGNGEAIAWGARDNIVKVDGEVIAKFDDGSAAIVRRRVGSGTVVYFAWLPGLSYAKSATYARGKLPWGFSPAIRDWIVAPVYDAGVLPPVEASVAMVETPTLISEAGAAVTVLNWNNDPLEHLDLTIRLPFAVKSVRSTVRGQPVKFQADGGAVHLSLPVGAADILVLRPGNPAGRTARGRQRN
jgi:hypothetical protein